MKIAKHFFAESMIVASAFAGVGHAQSQQQPVKNIVLVHGAFADGTSWVADLITEAANDAAKREHQIN